jgi:hypothetical protein
VAALKALRDTGMSVTEAINHYIAVERGEAPPVRAARKAPAVTPLRERASREA